MRKALTTASLLAVAFSAVVVGAPHRASADINGICQYGPPTLQQTPGAQIFPECFANRALSVMTQPNPSASPQNVNIVSMPSSGPYPTPIPFPSVQPVSAPTNLPIVAPAAKYTVLSASGTTSMSGAKVFIGAADASTSAQVTAVTCYDNASTASGAVLLNTVLGLTNPWFPNGGIGLTNGLTCNVPLALLGNGVLIYWRTF